MLNFYLKLFHVFFSVKSLKHKKRMEMGHKMEEKKLFFYSVAISSPFVPYH